MKKLCCLAGLILLLTCCRVLAEPWPVIVERYETQALERSRNSNAVWQIWKYATDHQRMDELRERWEAKAQGNEGRGYRFLLGYLEELNAEYELARGHFEKVIVSSPNDAQAWRRLGELEAAWQKPEARATLEKALELGGGDMGVIAPAAEALANWFVANEKLDEARALLARTLPKVEEPDAWVRLARLQATTALKQGKLAELLEQVKTAPPGKLGGSEIAEIYGALSDYAPAALELQAAMAKQPANALLRRQAVAVARSSDDMSAVARWWREETTLAPSPEAWREFFRVLLTNGSYGEARTVLAAHGAEIFSEPARWSGSIMTLWQSGFARLAADQVAKGPKGDGWEASILRAQLLLTQNALAPAQEALWKVLDVQQEAEPLTSVDPDSDPFRSPYRSPAAVPGAWLNERSRRLSAQLNGATLRLTNPEKGLVKLSAETYYESRDMALLCLAALAHESREGDAFVAKLENRLRGWPAIERMFAWATVQNAEKFLAETGEYLKGPRSPQVDSFCRNQVGSLRQLALPALAAAQLEQLDAAVQTLPVPPDPVTKGLTWVARSQWVEKELRGFRFEEAWSALRRTDGNPGMGSDRVLPGEVISISRNLVNTLANLKGTGEQRAQAAALVVRSALSGHRRSSWPSLGEGMGAFAKSASPTDRFASSNPGSGRIAAVSDAELAVLVYPPGSLLNLSEQTTLWMVFSEMRKETVASSGKPPSSAGIPPSWPLLRAQLEAMPPGIIADERHAIRAATAYLAWWNNDQKDAIARMQQLLADTGDPAVRLGLAAMMQKNGDARAASRLLEGFDPLPLPASRRIVQNWNLRQADRTNDRPAVEKLGKEIAAEPWTKNEARSLAELLKKSGAQDALARLQPRLREDALQEEYVYSAFDAISAAENYAGRPEAIDVARRLLASTDPRSSTQNSVRMSILAKLANLGVKDAYLSELRQTCAVSPENADAWMRLAEALPDSEAAAAWKKVLTLLPDDPMVIEKLLRFSADGDKRDILRKALAVIPQKVMANETQTLHTAFQAPTTNPELVSALEAMRSAGGARRYTPEAISNWRSLAIRFNGSGNTEAAVLVLQKAAEILRPIPPDMRQTLIQQLISQNRKSEAASQILDVVEVSGNPLPPVFAWRAGAGNTRASWHVDMQIIRQARQLSDEPVLRDWVKLEQTQSPMGRALAVSLRVNARDPVVLSVIEEMSAQTFVRYDEREWVLALATELSAWPEAHAVCRKLVAAYEKPGSNSNSLTVPQKLDALRILAAAGAGAEAAPRLRTLLGEVREKSSPDERWRVLPKLGVAALPIGDEVLIADISRAVLEAWAQGERQRSGNYLTETLEFVVALVNAKRAAAAEPIVEVIRKSPGLESRSDIKSQLDMLEIDFDLERGKLQRVAPMVWLDAARTKGDTATLVWDFGIASGSSNYRQPRVAVRDANRESRLAPFDVELFFGEDASAMQSLARLSKVEERGVWTGALPAATGFARVVFTRGDEFLVGEAQSIAVGQNLVHAEETPSFQPTNPAGEVVTLKGGPVGEVEYSAYRAGDSGRNSGGPVAVGPRIPIRAGRDVVLSGWFRMPNRYLNVGWRSYDREGKLLGSHQVETMQASGRLWSRYQKRLNWPRNNARGTRLPAAAAFLEPVVEGSMTFDLAGLSLIELPVSIELSEP